METLSYFRGIRLLIKKKSPFHSVPIEVQVSFPNDYPLSVPVFKIKNPERFFHPNIGPKGYVCDKILKKDGLGIRERVDGLIHVLYVPNETDSINTKAAEWIK